jgi:LmbE family N-acetylglucosaminyl deacetylase
VNGAGTQTLFVFAHQDDEYSAAPWILEELAAGNTVACVYLTSGGFRSAPAVRDAESRSALQALGVAGDAIIFLEGEQGRIGDRELAARSLEGLAMLERWIESAPFVPARIYAPSYEGGHPDHDASHAIAAAVASHFDTAGDAWHFSLYNAYRCPRPFFSTLRQLPTAAPKRRAATPWRTRLWLTMLCWRYRSQRRTWMALFPGALLARMILQSEFVARFAVARLTKRPHDGELLYERLFATAYDDFAAQTAEVRKRSFDSQPASRHSG